MSASVITTEMLVSAGSDDLTQMGYFADASYLRWVQAVVIMHWERFAPPAALASTLWIAVRHKMSYWAPGTMRDDIVARTKITRLKGVRAVFVTVFCREDTMLAEVESTWVCLDSVTKQPKALEAAVLQAFQIR